VAARGLDVSRLRAALRQLAEGVHALHLAGKLHRDIKPSNVLVTDEGRVVLLDFGVATELRRAPGEVEGEIVGTVRYMAPEQAHGEAPTPASDWYSVGVMLYEALVGKPPFAGVDIDVLTRKGVMDPAPPEERAPDVPPDLGALCMALLRRDANERLTGLDVLARLARPSKGPTPVPAAMPLSASTVLGRDRELAELDAAWAGSRDGRAGAAVVVGAAGTGKSTLLQFFGDRREGQGAVVLRGRVFERESVPYKAFDGIVDALTRHMLRRGESPRTSGPALPVEALAALARLFPVLRAVPLFAAAEPQPDAVDPVDPRAMRREALSALRALFGWLGEGGRVPVVLCIDDAHWGDVDSVSLVVEAVACGAFVVLSWQTELAEASPFLRELRVRWSPGTGLREVTLGPLAEDDARSLALDLLGSRSEDALEAARAIARESAGNPLLVDQLVRSIATKGWGARSAGGAATERIDAIIGERVARLEPEARTLLELVSVAGHPIELEVAAEAAGIAHADSTAASLHERRFVRRGLRGGREVVEMAHGRLATTVLTGMSRETVSSHHARLADLLARSRVVDAEAITMHHLAAGHDVAAAEWAERAASEAAAKLAFDQAARLYRLAIRTHETLSTPDAVVSALRVRLGEADAHLSSEDLEGPLRRRVEELMKMKRDIEEQEARLAELRSRIIEGTTGDDDAAEARSLEERLAAAREKFQEAVVDLPLDGDDPGLS
jgi:hypothetical protein